MTGAEPGFARFVAFLAQRLGLGEWEGSTPQTSLLDDLGLDSIQMLELLLALEEAGAVIDEEDLLAIETLGDAYRATERRVV